jgi:ferrous iron transport protein B
MAQLDQAESGESRRQGYFGRAGRFLEPLFEPLGWDWRITMAAMASFPAREVVVSVLGTIFNQGGDVDDTSEGFRAELRQATWENSDRPLFNVPVALSIMVFFALCSQCAATLAAIKRETNSWRWPAFSFAYMTALAYVGALTVYQITIRI